MTPICKQAVEALREKFIIKKNVHPLYYKPATPAEIEAVLKPFVSDNEKIDNVITACREVIYQNCNGQEALQDAIRGLSRALIEYKS